MWNCSRTRNVAAVLGWFVVAGNHVARRSWRVCVCAFSQEQKSRPISWIPRVSIRTKSSLNAGCGNRHRSPGLWPSWTRSPNFLSVVSWKKKPVHSYEMSSHSVHCTSLRKILTWMRWRGDRKWLDTVQSWQKRSCPKQSLHRNCAVCRLQLRHVVAAVKSPRPSWHSISLKNMSRSGIHCNNGWS